MNFRQYYYDLSIDESIETNGERGSAVTIRLLEYRPNGVTLLANNKRIKLGFTHFGFQPEIRTDGLTFRVLATRHNMNGYTYNETMLNLQKDARVQINSKILSDYSEYAFPTPGYKWSQKDDWWLFDTNVYGYHMGYDLYPDRGAPVVSVCDGSVLDIRHFEPKVERDDYWGQMVAILGCDGIVYGYMHCDCLAPNISIGATVSRGEYIGNVGRSGFESTDIGAHLHFEMILMENPSQFRFAFEDKPSVLSTPSRLLPSELGGFIANPYPYLREWYQLSEQSQMGL